MGLLSSSFGVKLYSSGLRDGKVMVRVLVPIRSGHLKALSTSRIAVLWLWRGPITCQ